MRWLLWAVLLVGAVWVLTSRGPGELVDQGAEPFPQEQAVKAPEPSWQPVPTEADHKAEPEPTQTGQDQQPQLQR